MPWLYDWLDEGATVLRLVRLRFLDASEQVASASKAHPAGEYPADSAAARAIVLETDSFYA